MRREFMARAKAPPRGNEAVAADNGDAMKQRIIDALEGGQLDVPQLQEALGCDDRGRVAIFQALSDLRFAGRVELINNCFWRLRGHECASVVQRLEALEVRLGELVERINNDR
jgi:hypothetical protein